MTPAHRTVKILLLQKAMTFADLAAATELTQTTIHNTLSGRTSSRKAKQAITNVLQAVIFPDVHPRPPFTFRAGTEMEYLTKEEAQNGAAILGDRVEIRGNVLTFVKDTQFTRLDIGPDPNLSAAGGKRTPHRKKSHAS